MIVGDPHHIRFLHIYIYKLFMVTHMVMVTKNIKIFSHKSHIHDSW
jgi:hypothetical protein